MSRIQMNEIDNVSTLSNDQQKAVHGGFGIYTPWGYIPYRAPVTSRYAFGFGGFTNQFSPGQLGFGIQAGTFNMQAGFAQQNSAWMDSFRSGW
ncbi:MAG: hypothetical protein AB8B93_16340 [Pseudomonadales bacterium]